MQKWYANVYTIKIHCFILNFWSDEIRNYLCLKLNSLLQDSRPIPPPPPTKKKGEKKGEKRKYVISVNDEKCDLDNFCANTYADSDMDKTM